MKPAGERDAGRAAAAAAACKACGRLLLLLVLLQQVSFPLSSAPSALYDSSSSPSHQQHVDRVHTSASSSPAMHASGPSAFPSLLTVEAAYFYVHEGQDKCFIESVPVGVPLTVSYKNTENPGVPCNIIYKDPQNRPVYSREVPSTETEGKLSYMTTTTGEYKVCISCSGGNKWLGANLLKWSVSIELGDTDINLEELAKREQVDSLQLKMQSISGRLEAMQKENDYERTHEERHQKTCEDTNSRIVWFSVLQLLLLCGTTHISVFYLVRYFQSQKVI